MSTLKEALALRRRELLQCVETEYKTQSVITLCPWQGKEWSLPWSRFEALIFGNEEEADRIELFFPHHQIVVLGQNLRWILDDLRKFHVYSLRSFPPAHRVKFQPGDPFIWQLDVKLVP